MIVLTANIFDTLLPLLEKGFWFIEVVIAFGILVAVHEFGHYIVAKLTGMKVEEYAIGFGKRIFGFKKGETEYSIRIIPFGGYCKIFGMEDEFADPDNKENSEKIAAIPPEERARAFNNRPRWAKFLVIIGGSAFNIVLAIIFVGIMGSAVGFNYAVIAEVDKDSPAARAGLLPGDKLRLFAYNSQRTNLIDTVSKSNPAKGILFRVQRDDGMHTIRVFPEFRKDESGNEVKRIGIRFSTEDNYSRTIERVLSDSPYAKAGLMSGDEIVSVDGKPIEAYPSLPDALFNSDKDEIQIGVLRDGKQFTFSLKDFLIYRTGLLAQTVPYKDGYALNVNDAILGTPAFGLQLQPGMKITRIDDKPITADFDWAKYEAASKVKEFMITIEDSKLSDKPITVPLSRVMPYPGIAVKVNYIKVPIFESFYESALQTQAFSLMIYDFFKSLFAKKVRVQEIAGPVGVMTIGYQFASSGFVNLVFFFTLISVNLGIINLLPFPGLDGGRGVFLIGEMIFRKPILKAQIENMIHLVGLAILFAWLIFITFYDLDRIVNMFR